MKRTIKKYGKVAIILLGLSIIAFALLIVSGIIWTSPSYYELGKVQDLKKPIMSMEEYSTKIDHPRPYIFHIKAQKGEVYVLGIEHTKDPNDPQIDSITRIWEDFKPTAVLVEGRLGFLFSWFQDPVVNHGEGGKTISLAKKDEAKYYTWEPDKQAEVNLMLKKFPAEKVALFYSLRPYLSNFRFGKPENPDEQMLSYIESRTDYDGIRGKITSVAQIDSIWTADFPNEKDWRNSTDEYGWPKGYLSGIAAYSNEVRDIHMCSSILDLMKKGEKVFVTMGSSHAFRIEETLRNEFF